jgi:perosamine synthetase
MISGSSVLHIALLLAGVGHGGEVLVPAWTFVATANAVRYTGAWPVALDVDEQHWQLDPPNWPPSCTSRPAANAATPSTQRPAGGSPLCCRYTCSATPPT